MRPTLALLQKELDQTRLPFAWLTLASVGVVWINLKLIDAAGGLLSYVSVASLFATPFLVIVAFAVGHLLIVREYYRGTQHFVSALPVNWLHMATVKYAVGLALLLILTFAVWLFAVALAVEHEPITTQFAASMAMRLVFFVLAIWSVVYTFSFLGRLRIPLLAGVVLFVYLLDAKTEFELSRFGPFALVNEDLFASERTVYPWRAILESVAVAIVPLILCRLFLLKRSGRLVEQLAVPMTRGEISFMAVLALGGLILQGSFKEDEIDVLPSLGDEYILATPRLEIGYVDPRFRLDAEDLSAYLAPRLVRLADLFSFPPEYIVRINLLALRRPHEYQTLFADRERGLFLGANFVQGSRWSNSIFSAYVIHQALAERTRDRFLIEPQHALFDGFATWLATDDRPGFNETLMLALYADEAAPLTAASFRDWDGTSERLGDVLGLGLAYSGWWSLSHWLGADVATAFAAAEYQRPVHGDIRDWWQDWRAPLAQRFERSTGVSWDEFISHWRADLDTLKDNPPYRDVLRQLPRGAYSAVPEQDGDGTRSITIRLTLDLPLPPESQCFVHHGILPGIDVPMHDIAIRIVPVTASGTDIHHALRGGYGSGTRVFTAIECELPGFALPLRLGSNRLTVP